MRKKYPYLEDNASSYSRMPQELLSNYPYIDSPYSYNLNAEQEKEDFLSKIDFFVNQKQYINITLLDWKENPIKEIQGIISSGSISKDGRSSVRRTATLSCSFGYGEYNVDDLEMDFSLNKKIFIEIGIENKTDEYPEYPILWFPQGIFYINAFSMNSSTSSAVNITLNLKDKMCLLNGDVGGTLPATIQFDTMTTQLGDQRIISDANKISENQSNKDEKEETDNSGTIVEQKVLYYNIIMELLQHWGHEDLNNIIIQDVPLRIKKIMQWNGNNDIFLWPTNSEETDVAYEYSFKEETAKTHNGYARYSKGDDIGYIYADFVPVGEIIGSAGDSVCTILDIIKNQLGNYEYFYDVFGIFHFREIKNYLNITQAETVLQESENPGRFISLEKGQFNLDTSGEIQYLIDVTNDKTTFSFTESKNITSINVNPNYSNIKNDYIINGIKKNSSGVEMAIRYRLVIDDKPEIIGYTNGKISENDSDEVKKNYYTTSIKASDPGATPHYGLFKNLVFYTYDEGYLKTNRLGKWVDVTKLPKKGNMDRIYRLVLGFNSDGEPIFDTKIAVSDRNRQFYMWNGTNYIKLYVQYNLSNSKAKTYLPEIYSNYYAIDWRTALLCYGLESEINGTDSGEYFNELTSFWPSEYNLRRKVQEFYSENEDKSIQFKSLTTGNFYFDMIDANSSSIGIYSVNNIGRRTDVYNGNNDINCLFAPEIPNVIILSKDPSQNWSDNVMITELRDIQNIKEALTEQIKECQQNGQPYMEMSTNNYNMLTTGGYLNDAYTALRYELFLHTNYQKTLTINALPAFYLEPNSRVHVSDASTNTYGDFIVQNISLTLGPGANMSVNMTEAIERL